MNRPIDKGSRVLAAALLAAASNHSMAQVGMSQMQVGTMPVTMSHPTHATSSQVNMGGFQADEAFCFQGALTPDKRAERLANYESAKNVPEAYLPSDLRTWHRGRTTSCASDDPRPDPRIAAVSLAVPLAAIFSADSLASIQIPVGLVAAQQDLVLLPRFHSAHVLKHCKACTSFADLPGAGHFDVLWPWPAAVAREVAARQVRGGLPVPGFDPALRDSAQAELLAFHRQHWAPSH